MNIMFTKSKPTSGLISRAMALLVVILGVQLGANGQSTNPAPYCNASHQYTLSSGQGSCCYGYGWAIKNVIFNTINHKPKCTSSGDGYRFFNSGPFTTITPGSSYDLTIQTQSQSYPTHAAAWIDWNQNNSFEASENVFLTGDLGYPEGKKTKKIAIPCSAKPGKTRMRVSIDYYYTWTTGMGCRTGGIPYGYGESLDYEITIATAGNPSANFLIPDSIFIGSPALFPNANQVGYVSHAWSTSVGGLGNVIDNKTNLSFAFPNTGSYQVRLTSTNCTGSSTVTKNVTVIAPSVPPTVRFLASRNYIQSDVVVDEIVDFKDYSTSGPTGYLWEITPDVSSGQWFEIGGSSTSNNVSIFFIDDDEYDVCMTASNAVGSTKLCKYKYVVIEVGGGGGGYANDMCTSAGSSLDSGIVYDPGGKDAKYTATASCQFNIKACDAEVIELWFEGDFTINYYARLGIYDGADVNGEELFLYNAGGSSPLTSRPSKHYFAKSGKVTVDFFNQYAGSYPGDFEIHWKVTHRNDGPLKAGFDILGTRNDSIYSCLTGTTVRFKNTTSGTRDINPNDYQWIFDFDPNIAYPAGYEEIPDNNDKVNAEYVYYNDKTYIVRLVAKSCEGWDTTYQTFHINSTGMVPQVDFSADQNILKVGESTVLHQKAVAGCKGTWTISPASYTILKGTLTSNDLEVKFNAAGRYTVKYDAENDNGTATRTKADFIRVIDYCNPLVVDAPPSMSINNVKFNSIDNKSTNDIGGYQNFTNLQTEVVVGGTYPLEIKRDQTVDASDIKVWIDYNRDGNLTSSELVAQQLNSTNGTFATNVTIPSIGAVTPGKSLMRVGIGLAGGKLDPCGPLDAGEYEDYIVNISLDNLPPVIVLTGPDSVYVEVNSTYTDQGATATDNLEGNITSRMVTKNQVQTNQTGIFLVTYNVKDGSGMPAKEAVRYVFVLADMTNPVLTVTGSTSVTHEVKTPYVDLGATATDNPGGVLFTNFIITNNNVDENKLGTYTVDYMVTDNYGNSANGTRTVEVVDTKAPVIDCGSAVTKIQVGTKFVNPTSIMDNYWKDVQLEVVTGSVNTDVFGEYKVTYTAKDGSGNAAVNTTCTYEVTDLIPPVLSSRGGQLVIADVNDFNFSEEPVEGHDNYFKTVPVVRNAGGFDITKLGTYDVTYTGTDGAGNVTTWVRTIKVVDRVKPVVISTPINVMRWQTIDPMAGVSTWDNYYAPADFKASINGCKLEIISSNANPLFEGLYQIIYQAVDGSGNISDPHMRLVSVTANTTGVSEVLADAVNIYPNPNSGNFEVVIGTVLEGNTTVTITDMAGKMVKAYQASDIVNGTLSVNLTDAAAGVYFVQVTNNGQVANKKVTITR